MAGADFDGNAFVRDVAARIASAAATRDGIEIAHLKMTLTPAGGDGDLAVLNQVRNEHAAELSHTLDGELSRGELIVNLRAEGDPARLAAAVDAATLDAADAQSLVVTHGPLGALPAGSAQPDPPAHAGLGRWHPMSSRVLYCHCAFAQAVPRPVKQDVLRALTDRGDDFDAVADLCEMSARKDPALKEFAACEQLTLVACYPRALRWMFSAAGAPLDESRVRVLNMRAATAEQIVAGLDGADARRRRPSSRSRPGRAARSPDRRRSRSVSAAITARSPLLVVLYEGAGAMPLDADARFEITRTLLEKGYRVITHAGRPQRHDAGRAAGARARPLHRRAAGRGRRRHRRRGPLPLARRRRAGRASSRSSKASAATPRRRSRAAGSRGSRSSTTAAAPTACSACRSACSTSTASRRTSRSRCRSQTNCKTDCPACSRVCPEVAILFPKYKAGPINGDEVNAADLEREKMKVDISALLGGDIYAALRQRSQHASSRFARERDDQRALEERKRCLAKLQAGARHPGRGDERAARRRCDPRQSGARRRPARRRRASR